MTVQEIFNVDEMARQVSSWRSEPGVDRESADSLELPLIRRVQEVGARQRLFVLVDPIVGPQAVAKTNGACLSFIFVPAKFRRRSFARTLATSLIDEAFLSAERFFATKTTDDGEALVRSLGFVRTGSAVEAWVLDRDRWRRRGSSLRTPPGAGR